MSRAPSRLTRRSLLLGTAACAWAITRPAFTKPLFLRGGHGRAVVAPPPTALSTFTIANTAGASTSGIKRIGLPIGPNDVPSGSVLEIQRGGTALAQQQFDQRSTYRFTVEGLKFCSAALVDTDFAANESRTYSLIVKSGSWDNTSAVTLADALAGTDYNVAFTGITGTVSGSIADITASLNTHAAIDTRVLKYESGPAVDSWEIWGETSHPELLVIWYFSRWKDASGNLIANEVTPVMSMPWWTVPGKEKLVYDAALLNGASVLDSYTGVEHLPHADWALVRTQNDDQHADRIWDGAARPTLIYKPDQVYWQKSNLFPIYDLTSTYTNPTVANTYIPGRALGHRYAIDDPATFAGEGIMPDMDIYAFCRQTATDIRIMRVNAYVSAHVPYHFRSPEVTTKPGRAADKAHTLCPMIMKDQQGNATPPSQYDFTADGMPVANDYYNFSGFERAGWASLPAGSYTMSDGTWSYSKGASHAVNYAHGALLWSGERFFMKWQLEIGATTIHQRAPTTSGAFQPVAFWSQTPIPGYAVYPGATSTIWTAIGGTAASAGTTRIVPHLLNLLSTMGYIQDDDVQTNYVDALLFHHEKFFSQSLALIPSTGNGAWSWDAPNANFMCYYFTIETYYTYARSRLSGFKDLAEYVAKVQISYPANNITGMSSAFHYRAWQRTDITWDAVNNEFLQDGMLQSGDGMATFPGGTTVTTTATSFPWTNGDIVVFPINEDTNGAQLGQTWPPEITPEQFYYVVNAPGTSSLSFQFSATPGGAAISVSAWPKRDILLKKFASGNPAKWIGVKNPTDYGKGCRAAFMVARNFGHPLATATDGAKYDAMYSAHPFNARWNMKTV